MRTFNLLTLGNWKSVKVLIGICEMSPQQMLGYSDIFKRVRIVDALKKAETTSAPVCVLEDEDWSVLVAMIEGPCSNLANKDILNIMTAVKEAKYSEAA